LSGATWTMRMKTEICRINGSECGTLASKLMRKFLCFLSILYAKEFCLVFKPFFDEC